VIGSTHAVQHPGLHQGAHALFQEEGVALRARNQALDKRLEGRMLSKEAMQQCLGAFRWEQVEPELRVVCLATPAMVIFKTVVDEEYYASRRQAVDQAVQDRLRLSVDPVQILHHQEQGLGLARPQQQACAGRQRALAALRRLEGLPGRIVHGDVQEREHGRQGRFKGHLQHAKLAHDLVMDRLRRAHPAGSRP
jgi:hypothetical protein